MIYFARLGVLLSLMSLLAVPAARAANSLPPTALLRIHSTFQGGSHGFTYYDQDFFVSRDRGVTAVLTQNYLAAPLPLDWTTSHVSTKASAASFQVLIQALEENHVGIQDGACSITNTIAPLSGTFEVTWYGKGARRSTFSIAFNSVTPPPPCSTETIRLYRAIQSFAYAAGVPGLGPGLNLP